MRDKIKATRTKRKNRGTNSTRGETVEEQQVKKGAVREQKEVMREQKGLMQEKKRVMQKKKEVMGEPRSYAETMVGLLGWVGAMETAQLQALNHGT